MNQELREYAIEWFLDCSWADEPDEDELNALSDVDLISALDRHFSGGYEAFKAL